MRSGGNCYWFPKCGSCDQEKDKCNTIYSTSNSDPCPESLYYTVGDKPAGSDTPTMSPTCSAPIPAPQMPTEPNPPAPAPSAAVTHRMMTMFMVFVLSTIYFVIWLPSRYFLLLARYENQWKDKSKVFWLGFLFVHVQICSMCKEGVEKIFWRLNWSSFKYVESFSSTLLSCKLPSMYVSWPIVNWQTMSYFFYCIFRRRRDLCFPRRNRQKALQVKRAWWPGSGIVSIFREIY